MTQKIEAQLIEFHNGGADNNKPVSSDESEEEYPVKKSRQSN